MPIAQIPDLTLSGLAYGTHETCIDLRCLLYAGGAEVRIDLVENKINSGALGPLIHERFDLVSTLYNDLVSDINKGLKRSTITNRYKYIRKFFAWCDQNDLRITTETVENNFYAWAEHLKFKANNSGKFKLYSAYRQALATDYVISRAIGLKHGLTRNTRLSKQQSRKQTLTTKADNQNLQETFALGSLLKSISACLTKDAVYGALPVRIELDSGRELIEWCGLTPTENLKSLQRGADSYTKKLVLNNRLQFQADKSHRTRFPLINLRIEAELLIFISQTGMNLSQAFNLHHGKFRYQTTTDETLVYQVFKNRRQGEASFRIYNEYRSHFETYLAWINEMFPEGTDRLFPFIYPYAIPREGKSRPFQAIIKRSKQLNIKYIPPKTLRNTRVNWLLRKSRDTSLTAEIAQHTKETLLSVYEKPNHQVAALEISRFYRATDPSITPPGPGTCVSLNQKPLTANNTPKFAPIPDCINPAGCLFCEFHRDVDSLDYTWALTTYRYLKFIELDKFKPNATSRNSNSATTLINRINLKLNSFRDSSEIRKSWTEEAEARVKEGRYHLMFDGVIQLMEIAP